MSIRLTVRRPAPAPASARSPSASAPGLSLLAGDIKAASAQIGSAIGACRLPFGG